MTQPYRYEAVVNCGSCVQILAAPPTTWPCTPKHKGVDLTGKHFRVAQGLVALELGTKQPQLWIIPRRNGAGEKCRSSLKERSGGVIILGPADGAKHRYPKAMSPGGLGFFGICRDRLLSPMTSPAIAFPKYLTPFYWRVWPYFSEGRAPTSHGQREVSQVRRWRLRWIRMRTGAMWSQDQKEHAGDGWRC